MPKQRGHGDTQVRGSVEIDEGRLDELLRGFVQPGSPGIVVGISHGGRPVYRKGVGLASMELPHALSPSIRMHVGSVSKQFTAFGFLLLCESGRASIDDHIGKFFPEFHPVTHRITMRQLLGHTSGLPDACNIRFRLAGFEGRSTSTGEILAQYRSLDELQDPPDTKWRYNNAGYMILSEVIERVAGTSLEEYLADSVFSRTGMWDTVVRRSDTEFLPNSASAHTLTAGRRFERRYFGVDPSGAGSVVSTADDMLRWLAHMERPIVGSAETWAMMKTPRMLANGVSTGYGFGLSLSRYRGIDTIGHLGGWIGGSSYALKIPSAKMDVVVISNRSDVFSVVVANRILDSCISNLAAAGDSPPGGEAVSMYRRDFEASLASQESGNPAVRGNFHSRKTGRVVQLFGRDGQQIVSIDGYDVPFRRRGDCELVPIPEWGGIGQSVLLLGKPEAPRAVRLSDFGEVDELTLIPAKGADELQRLAGRYRAASLDAMAEIAVKGGIPRLHVTSPFGSMEYTLERMGQGFWRMNSELSAFLDAILLFQNGCSEFRLNAGTDARLGFRRER